MASTHKRLSAKQRAAMIAAARSYLDVPFRHRGRSVRGIDCLGLVVLALAAVRVTVADRKDYGRDPSRDGLSEAARAHFGAPIPLKSMRAGDVVLMRWHEQPNHVGIITDYPLGGLALLHADAAQGRVVEHRLADPWPRRIVEAYRV